MAQVQGQWTAVGAMQSPRGFDAQARLINGQVLAAGGTNTLGAPLASAELFTPATAVWTPTGTMFAARTHFRAITLANGDVLAMGGVGSAGAVLASAELYDHAAGTWSAVGPMALARSDHAAILLANGKVLVAGGCTLRTAISDCAAATAASEIFDPATKTWSATGSLALARTAPQAVRLADGRVLAVGGATGAVTLVATGASDLYDPASGQWTAAPSAAYARFQSAITLLASGKVLVTGGGSGKNLISSAELYDPAANAWSGAGSMTTFRYGHTATMQLDGNVLIVGGVNRRVACGRYCVTFVPSGASEIYNPATGVFTAASPVGYSLAYHSTILLGNGKTLADGGSAAATTCCAYTNAAQAYTPLTLAIAPYALNFGHQQVGGASLAQTIAVNNPSPRIVAFSGIAASVGYAQTNTCPATLNPGQQCAVTVTFVPNAAGARAGAVTLSDNSLANPKQTVALAGIGESAALALSPPSVSLTAPVTLASVAAVTMTNYSSAPVAVGGVSIAPANGTFTQTNDCAATLGVQQACTIMVVFTPPDVGNYAATLSAPNGAGAALTLPLSGTGSDAP